MGTPEDLIEVERAGRRCAMCQTGRRWRQFEVVRPEGQEPVVMCAACFARYGAAPPVRATEQPVSAKAKQAPPTEQAPPATVQAAPPTEKQAVPAPSAPSAQPAPAASARQGASEPQERAAPREDRLRKALRELPHGEHSVGRIAKAAGLNHEKTIRRLQSLHAAGEVQQIGKRWSNEPPSTDIEAAMDRLQARTTNLRIVRSRESVG